MYYFTLHLFLIVYSNETTFAPSTHHIMSALLFILIFIASRGIYETMAVLNSCPTMMVPSVRYSITLSSSKIISYTGSLLLSSNGNFIFLFTIPATESPQSAIQGTWSLSDCTNSLTFNAQTLYFMDLPNVSVTNLTCIYTCGTDINAQRTCTIMYTLKTLQVTGTYAMAMDLSHPE